MATLILSKVSHKASIQRSKIARTFQDYESFTIDLNRKINNVLTKHDYTNRFFDSIASHMIKLNTLSGEMKHLDVTFKILDGTINHMLEMGFCPDDDQIIMSALYDIEMEAAKNINMLKSIITHVDEIERVLNITK